MLVMWIETDKKLPSLNKSVIVTIEERNEATIAYRRNNGAGWVWHNGISPILENVLAWMPLPSIYDPSNKLTKITGFKYDV